LQNLLRKIRELLYTLTPSEFYVLERLLCQLEEPVDLERKLQVHFLPFFFNSCIFKSVQLSVHSFICVLIPSFS
jgi:hypothetical protein